MQLLAKLTERQKKKVVVKRFRKRMRELNTKLLSAERDLDRVEIEIVALKAEAAEASESDSD